MFIRDVFFDLLSCWSFHLKEWGRKFLEQLEHNPKSGPLTEAELVQALHNQRLAVSCAKIDRDFDQISAFQRFVRLELEAGKGPKWTKDVEELAAVIEREAFVRMYAEIALQQIPPVRRHFDSVHHMLDAINYVVHTAPIYKNVSSISWQFPLSALMNFWMMTPAGKKLMRMPQFNSGMNAIMKAWCVYLDSPESRNVLNEGPTGWLNPEALEYNQVLEDYVIPDKDAPYWGWTSYNDFFHRMVRADKRPIDDPDSNRTINSPNDGVAWAVEHYVQRNDAFWLKSQAYSMANLLNNGPLVDSFVGGTVYQTYVNGGADWHGFSAPINGTIVGLELIEGYAWTESDEVGPDPMSGPYSQGWAAGVATRGLIYIDSHDAKLGIVCVVPIGLTEVSSLAFAPGLKEGSPVKKGDLLGNFSFGGSSFAVVFQPGAIKELLVMPPLIGRNAQQEDTLRANKKFAIANLEGDEH